MSCVGVGVDIELIERFVLTPEFRKKSFLKNIFTARELAYCLSKAKPAEHLAARFAAKEAITKALLSFGQKYRNFKTLEIWNTKTGIPRVRMFDSPNISAKISLAHCKDKAIAFAVVTKK